MALVHADLVEETSTSTGTSDYALAGATTNRRAFSVIGDGNTCYYRAWDLVNGGFEVGIGTYVASGPTLQRTTILSSSNSGSAVSWVAGTRTITNVIPAEKFAGKGELLQSLLDDTSPQLGGDLDANGHNLLMGGSGKVEFIDSNWSIYSDNTNGVIFSAWDGNSRMFHFYNADLGEDIVTFDLTTPFNGWFRGGLTVAGGNLDVNSNKIVNLATPTTSTDAATKAYVDAVAAGLSVKNSVLYATAAALPTNSYSNGTSGAGATITASANGALSVDGNSPAVGDRILVKNEATASHNGIYTVTTAGDGSHAFVLTRASDFDTTAEIFPGAFTFVEAGTANAGAGFVLTTTGSITVGTTSLTFTQFSGAGEITVNSPITKSGNALSFDISGQTEDTSPDITADFVLTWDASASGFKKVKPQSFPFMQLAANQTLTAGGFRTTPYSIGTISSGTVTPDAHNGNYQYLTNNGAFTLAAPANAGSAIDIEVTNASSAGAITFSGFTVPSGGSGSALDTTSGHKFIISIRYINAAPTYSIMAMQ